MSLKNYLIKRGDQGNDRYKMFLGIPLWKILQRDCGLTLYTTPFLGKIGKADRDAVPNEALIGNGVTHATFEFTQASALWDVEFEVSDTTLAYRRIIDCTTDGGVGFITFDPSGNIIPSSGTLSSVGLKYTVVDISITFSKLAMLATGLGNNVFDKNLSYFKMTNKSTGLTYTLNTNTRQSSGIIPLNITDANGNAIGVIQGQQEFSPVIPTEVSQVVKTQQDANGVTVAKSLTDNKVNALNPIEGIVDQTTGNVLLSSSWRCSYFIELPEDRKFFLVDTESPNTCSYDKDFNFIELYASTGLHQAPANAKYVRTSWNPINASTVALYFSEVALPYVPYSGYSFKSDLSEWIEDGTEIACGKDGTLFAYISDGSGGSYMPKADSIGAVMKKFRPVDGVVDLKTIDITPRGSATYQQDYAEITVQSNPADAFSRVYTEVIQSTQTLKTLKCKCEFISGADGGSIVIKDGADSATLGSITFSVNNQEETTTFTPPVDGKYIIRFYGNDGTAEAQEKRYYNFRTYEGTTEPTSGSFESGNSIVIADDYFINDPEYLLYNSDGSKKVIPFDDLANITNNQLIVSEDKQSIYFYDEPLDVDSECFEKALKQAKLIEPLQTTEDSGIENTYTTESTGIELAYCYKDFVEVE